MEENNSRNQKEIIKKKDNVWKKDMVCLLELYLFQVGGADDMNIYRSLKISSRVIEIADK